MTCSTPCSPNLTPQRERSRASLTKTVRSVSIRSRKYVGSSCKTSKDVSQVCVYVCSRWIMWAQWGWNFLILKKFQPHCTKIEVEGHKNLKKYPLNMDAIWGTLRVIFNHKFWPYQNFWTLWWSRINPVGKNYAAFKLILFYRKCIGLTIWLLSKKAWRFDVELSYQLIWRFISYMYIFFFEIEDASLKNLTSEKISPQYNVPHNFFFFLWWVLSFAAAASG